MKNTKTNTLPKGLQNVLTKLDTVMSDDYQPAETALDRVLFAQTTAQDTTDTVALKARIAELEANIAELQRMFDLNAKNAVLRYRSGLQKGLAMSFKDIAAINSYKESTEDKLAMVFLMMEEITNTLNRNGIQFDAA